MPLFCSDPVRQALITFSGKVRPAHAGSSIKNARALSFTLSAAVRETR